MGRYDFSTLSDKDLAESLALMNRDYWEKYRPDEGVDSDDPRFKSFHEQYSALKEECSLRGIVTSRGILDKQLDEKIATVRRQLHLLNSIPYWAHEDPSNLFDGEIAIVKNDRSLRFQVRLAVKYDGRDRFQRYLHLVQAGEKDVKLRLLGRTFTPENDWEIIDYYIEPYMLPVDIGLSDPLTKKGLQLRSDLASDTKSFKRTIRSLIESADIPSSDFITFKRICGGIAWLGEIDTVIEYISGVNYLIGKNKPPGTRDYKPEGMLAKSLTYSNIELINNSFQNPVFVNYLYEGRLPAFSWSMRDGEPMMRAMTTGEYEKSYNSEINLIERTVRDIGERYGLGKN
jgi:hypothetical protein